MFKQSINNTPFTTDMANSYFTNITGGTYGSDKSFLATFRALVAPRIPKEESINIMFGRSNHSAATISQTPARVMVETICSGWYPDSGVIYIHSISNATPENVMANFELLKAKFTEIYSGWHRQERFTDFYRKSFNTLCFSNPELKSTVIFVENLDNRRVHYLQAAALAMVPWYFDPKDGLSAEEIDFLKSLREKTPEKYLAYLEKFVEKYDFKSARVRQLLAGFETRFERIECDRVRNDIATVDRQITNLNNQIADYLRTRNEHCLRLMGLETKIAQGEAAGDSEIMEYFLCNKRLILESVNGNDLYFAVRDYLTYYDETMAKRIIDNASSYCYYVSTRISHEKIKKLMRAVFVDQRIKIRFCAAYRLSLNGGVSTCGGHDFGADFTGYMPNPHIDGYNCMGNYGRTINELLRNNDYIGAIEQCIASCKSLNFADSTVMECFMKSIYGSGSYASKNTCFELPDGSVVNPANAIKWIEEQEKEGTNE